MLCGDTMLVVKFTKVQFVGEQRRGGGGGTGGTYLRSRVCACVRT